MTTPEMDEVIKQYSSWDYTIDHAKVVDEVSEDERTTAVNGIRSMRAVLGEDWLSKVLRSRHPIIHYLLNRAPWTRVWLGDFGTELQDLSESTNFQKLSTRLTSATNFWPAHFEMTVAHDFWRAGYSIEFYPKWKGGEYDFLASKDGSKFAVEASIIYPAEEARWATRTFFMLTNPHSFEPGLLVVGKVFKALSARRIADAKKKVDGAMRRAKETGQPTEITIDGVLDFLILSAEKRQEAEAWTKRKGYQFGLEGPGPAHGYDEVGRIAKAMKEEYRQLPKDVPGVVALLDEDLGYMADARQYPKLVGQVEEDVYNQGRLSLLALYFNNFAFDTERLIRGKNFIMSNRKVGKMYSLDVLAIKNVYCDDGDVDLLQVFRP